MHLLTLGSIIDSSDGLLLTIDGLESVDAFRDRTVTGIELYQFGVDAVYRDRLIIATQKIESQAMLDTMIGTAVGAAAFVLPGELVAGVQKHQSTVLLRRPPWVSTDALLRGLVALTGKTSTESTDERADLMHGRTLAARRQDSALLALLGGTQDAAVAAALVGLRPDLHHVVVAADVDSALSDQYRLALTTEFPDSHSVLSGSICFSVLPVHRSTDSRIVERLRSRLGRAVRAGADLPVGVGSLVPGVFALHESAAAAREILRALRLKLGTPWVSGHTTLRVAGPEDVPDALALIRAADALQSQGESLSAPLMMLATHDREHGSALLPSVLAALEYRHNYTDAARTLGIHPNSLRGRLDRAKEVSGVDLTDPVSALRAMIAFLANPEAHNTARGKP